MEEKELLELVFNSLTEGMKLVRSKNNLTQEEMATKLGVSRATLVNIERGAQKPNIALIVKLMLEFNLTLDELLPIDIMQKKVKLYNMPSVKNFISESRDFLTA